MARWSSWRSIPSCGRTLAAILEVPWLDDAGRLEALFLATLSRPPTAAERERFLVLIKKGGRNGLADVFWTLLNSSEFLFNH